MLIQGFGCLHLNDNLKAKKRGEAGYNKLHQICPNRVIKVLAAEGYRSSSKADGMGYDQEMHVWNLYFLDSR